MKNYVSVILTFALCAVTLFALYCTKPEFDNPLDPNGTHPRPPKFTKFAVTFDANGGEVVPVSDSTGSDSTLAVLPMPETRDGYTFVGWFTVKGTTGGNQVTVNTKFTKNSTVYARWVSDAEQYKIFSITFNANGGSDEPAKVKTKPDSTLAELPKPKARDGYVFVGWFTVQETTGGTQISTVTKFRSDSTVYARWVSDGEQYKIFSITFNANGGSDEPAIVKTKPDSTLAELPKPKARDGYTFAGWFNVQETTGGTQVSTGTKFKSDSTAYARWISDSEQYKIFEITLNPNGGSVNPASVNTVEDSTLASLLEPEPRLGYRFDGWFTQQTGGIVVTTSTKFTKDTTIYARWTQKFKVEFATNGGGSVEAQYINPPEGLLDLPVPPTRAYWNFDGWFLDNLTFQNRWNFETDKVTSNITLYANWTLVIVTLNANKGTVQPLSVQVNSSGRLDSIPKPIRTGYTHTGWYTTAETGGTPVTVGASGMRFPTDSTIYARWTPIKYQIIYHHNNDIGTKDTAYYNIENTPVTLVTSLTRTGYTFQGWNANSNLTGDKVESIPANSIGDREYWANWKINTYTITFNTSGGGAVEPAKVTHGGSIESLPLNLTRPGYAFGYWFTEQIAQSNGDWVIQSTKFTADDTIYARWYASAGSQLNDARNYDFFTDTRDYVTYRTIKIGEQVWMAENLNYKASGTDTVGVCYENSIDSCTKYGRLYTWAEAMGVDKAYNSTLLNKSDLNHQGICPDGWHLPSDAEWTILMDFVGSDAGTELKSQTGWRNTDSGDIAGTDVYGFSALPGGYVTRNGNSTYNVYHGFWWSATEYDVSNAWNRLMTSNSSNVDGDAYTKGLAYSVRCVMD